MTRRSAGQRIPLRGERNSDTRRFPTGRVPAERDLIAHLVARLERDAQRIASAFALHYRAIEPERPHVRRRLGVCYSDGTIRIRLFHARTGRPLKYSSLVDTLCHELAHLRHFNHGRRFQALYRRILEHARRVQIYRPGPGADGEREVAGPPLADRAARARGHRAPSAAAGAPRACPEQLALFGVAHEPGGRAARPGDR